MVNDLVLAEILPLSEVDIAVRLADASDEQLEALINLTDAAAVVNRLARIERGRRTERHLGGRGQTLTPGVSLSAGEMRNRSEERTVAEWVDTHPDTAEEVVAENGWHKLVDIARGKQVHVAQNSGENEWYTPAHIIDAATTVLGTIDLDPASSPTANKVVGASLFYTKEDGGLDQKWKGTVWLNPPYLTGLVERFTDKLCREYVTGEVSAACLLVNNGTETAWFQRAANVTNAVCFPKGRISYWHTDHTSKTPLQGQAVFYFGADSAKFKRVFGQIGAVFEHR